LTDRVIAFAQHGLTEPRGQTCQWWAAARGPLAQHDVLVRVSALDFLIWTLSFFDGVMISSKNTSWRTADAPTLIQNWQSVVYLTTGTSPVHKGLFVLLQEEDGSLDVDKMLYDARMRDLELSVLIVFEVVARDE